MNIANRTFCTTFTFLAALCVPLAYAADEPKAPAPGSAPATSSMPAPTSTPAATSAPTSAPENAPAGAPKASGGGETGLAAVYSDRLNGRKTASGARYDRNRLTAAHKTLPFGTRVKVTNISNHKTVTVQVNDRGPTQAGRILDLSPAAAKALGIRPKGMAEATAEVVAEAPTPAKK